MDNLPSQKPTITFDNQKMETDEIEEQKQAEPKQISKAKHKKERFIFADVSDQEGDQVDSVPKGLLNNQFLNNNLSDTIKLPASMPPLKQNVLEIKDRLIDTPDPMSVITSDSYPKIVKINSSPKSPQNDKKGNGKIVSCLGVQGIKK